MTLGTISGDSNYVYGDAVTVQLNGSGGSPKLQTSGHEAYGLLAQSIGGGGGVITDISSATTVSAQLGTQAVGGNNAAGGTVTIDDFVDLNTYGDDAHGIVARKHAWPGNSTACKSRWTFRPTCRGGGTTHARNSSTRTS